MPSTGRAYLLCGPSLAGKTSAAQKVARRIGAVIVSADDINAERNLPFGCDGLPDSLWAETLRIQVERFREYHAQGRSVVIDDTLCYRWLRDRWRQEAQALGADHVLLLLAPTEEDLLCRQRTLSNSRERPVISLSRLREHLGAFEWPTAEEHAVNITTVAELDAWLHSEVEGAQNAT